MKILVVLISLISTAAFAETGTFTVDGMGCAGCKKAVSEKVCDDPSMKEKFESCQVSIISKEKHTGQIVVVAKKDQKVDVNAIKAGVKAASVATGDAYTVSKEEVK